MMTSESEHLSSRLDLAFLASLPLFAHVPSDLLEVFLNEDVLRFYQDGNVLIHQGISLIVCSCSFRTAPVLTDGVFLLSRSPYDILERCS